MAFLPVYVDARIPSAIRRARGIKNHTVSGSSSACYQGRSILVEMLSNQFPETLFLLFRQGLNGHVLCLPTSESLTDHA